MEPGTLTIEQFMTTEPCTVSADLSLFDAQDRMAANNIRHLLVERTGRLVGIVSSRDASLIGSLGKIDTRKVPVSDAMSDHVFTCAPSDRLSDVALEMEAHRFGCAVVVDKDVVVGIFTTTDALRAVRQLVEGQPVERAVKPTHVLENPPARNLNTHHMRVSDSLRAHGVTGKGNLGLLHS